MEPGKGFYLVPGEPLALQPCPGPCGVNSLQMAAALKFAGQFEVVEDAKNSLNNSHGDSEGRTETILPKGMRIDVKGSTCCHLAPTHQLCRFSRTSVAMKRPHPAPAMRMMAWR